MSNHRDENGISPSTDHESVAMADLSTFRGHYAPLDPGLSQDERIQAFQTPRASVDTQLPKYTARAQNPQRSEEGLFRQSYLLFLVVLYCCLAVIPWALLCVQRKKPLTSRTYGYDRHFYQDHRVKAMDHNLKWFHALRVFLSIANTLVIPITSTVCAGGAVVYVQQFGKKQNLRLSVSDSAILLSYLECYKTGNMVYRSSLFWVEKC